MAWSEARDGAWLEERLMYVSELADVMTKDVLDGYETYWVSSCELDELERASCSQWRPFQIRGQP